MMTSKELARLVLNASTKTMDELKQVQWEQGTNGLVALAKSEMEKYNETQQLTATMLGLVARKVAKQWNEIIGGKL